MKTDLKFEAYNHPQNGEICAMQLWPPAQGTEWHSVPISLDLEFAAQSVEFPDFVVEVSAKSAIIHLVVEQMEICRGTKFGEDVLEPYAVLEVQETVSKLVEEEAIGEFKGGFDISRSFLGEVRAFWRRVRRKKKQSVESLNVERRVSRVAPTTRDRWKVSEPYSNGKLSGKYLGLRSDGQEDPLCLVSLFSPSAKAEIYLFLDAGNLFFEFSNSAGKMAVSRNREAIISEIARCGISNSFVMKATNPPHKKQNELLIGYATLQAEAINE